jgi:hypothetical protein
MANIIIIILRKEREKPRHFDAHATPLLRACSTGSSTNAETAFAPEEFLIKSLR